MPYKFDINTLVHDSVEQLAVRVHDIADGRLTLQYLLQDLKKGYKFDDDMAPKKLATVERAIETVLKESDFLITLLNSLRAP